MIATNKRRAVPEVFSPRESALSASSSLQTARLRTPAPSIPAESPMNHAVKFHPGSSLHHSAFHHQ